MSRSMSHELTVSTMLPGVMDANGPAWACGWGGRAKLPITGVPESSYQGRASKGGLGTREVHCKTKERGRGVRLRQPGAEPVETGRRWRTHDRQMDGRTDDRRQSTGRPGGTSPASGSPVEHGKKETVSAGTCSGPCECLTQHGDPQAPQAGKRSQAGLGATTNVPRHQGGSGAEPGRCLWRRNGELESPEKAKRGGSGERWGRSGGRAGCPSSGAAATLGHCPTTHFTGGETGPASHPQASRPCSRCWGGAGGPVGGAHLTTNVTDGHVDKDGGLFHPLQVHVPVA